MHRIIRFCPIAIILIFFALSASAQSSGRVVEVIGYLSNQDGYPVQYAHIVNINRYSSTVSDTSGRFRIVVVDSDTLRISCLGYEATGFSLRGLDIPQGQYFLELGDIVMKPKVYELSTISIYAERWKSFLYDYEHVEMAEEPFYVKQIEHWKENLIQTDELKQLTQAARGTGFSLDFNRKRAKAQKKIEEFKRQDILNQEAAEKYNPRVVADITGMSIDESEQFVKRFRLDRDFVISRNDYDIYLIVKQLYQEYKPKQ